MEAAQQAYQALQLELQGLVARRQQLEAQLNENAGVQRELASLTPNNTVYKLVGGVLLKQDADDAKGNVAKRLEFIAAEIARIDAKVQETEARSEAKRTELMQSGSAPAPASEVTAA